MGITSLFGLWRELRVFVKAALHPQTPWPTKLLLLGAIVYVIMPADIIPDVIPVLGQMDDLLALIAAGYAFLKMTHAVRERLRLAR